MSGRTRIILLAAVVVGAVTFFVGRELHHTLLFLPLFLFWSWGDKGRREEVVVDDDSALEERLIHTDGVGYWQDEQEDQRHRDPDRPHQPQAS